MRLAPFGNLLGAIFSGPVEDALTGGGGARRGKSDLSLMSRLSNSSLALSVALFLAGDADLAFDAGGAAYTGAIVES